MKISIISAAKNEEGKIESFISSIKNLDYPKENFELVIVDDNSTDITNSLACKLIEGQNNFRLIKADTKFLDAKRGALLEGIQKSRFPFIVITDADCIPSGKWLKTCAGQFERGKEFIFGPAPYYREDNFINNISSFENLKNQFLSFSLAVLGMPYTCGARNMGFSKEAFYKMGGYNHTLETLSGDDDLLLREAVKNKLKISAFYNKDAMVFSYTKSKLKEYLNQKARHIQSSFYYLLRSRVVLAVWHLLNLFMLFSPLLIFLNFNFIWLFASKIICDFIIILSIQNKFEYNFNLLEIFYYDIIYEIFLIINFFNAHFKKINWK
ncbi:MAG TPA: glycosyltransferase [Ignavibacteriaceae bacterium]|nr:glycosyltransferase [Ignavibacteriaceae bacterium]